MTLSLLCQVWSASTAAGGGGADTVTVQLSAANASFIGGDHGNMSLNDYDVLTLLLVRLSTAAAILFLQVVV